MATVASLAAAVGVGIGVGPSAAAEPVEHTQWLLGGDFNDYILGPEDYTYDADDGFTVTGGLDGVSVSIDLWPEGWWDLRIKPVVGDVLEAGRTYTGATRWPLDPNTPNIDISGSGRGCSSQTGQFTVNEIEVDGDGVVTALNVTAKQYCHGSGPAAYTSVAWHSSLPPEALPPRIPAPTSLVFNASKRAVTYGDTVKLRGRLYADSDVQTLSLYAQLGRAPRTLVATFEPRADGTFSRTVVMQGSTRYTVEYDGPGAVSDARQNETVTALSLLRTKVARASGKRGKYHLIRKGKRTYFLVSLLPKSPKECMTFRAQYFVRGYWDYDGVLKCAKLTKRSQTGVYFDWDKDLAGIPIRIRAEWKGNELGAATRSPWAYLTMVDGRVAAMRTAPLPISRQMRSPIPAT